MFKVNLSGYKTSVFFDQNGAFIDIIRGICIYAPNYSNHLNEMIYCKCDLSIQAIFS